MSKGKRVRAQRSAPPPVGKKTAPDRRLWIGAVALGALLVVGIAVAAIRSGGSSGTPVHVDFAGMTGLQDGPPPWNNGSGALQDRLASIDLTPLAQEALAFHIHQHLDVYVDQQEQLANTFEVKPRAQNPIAYNIVPQQNFLSNKTNGNQKVHTQFE